MWHTVAFDTAVRPPDDFVQRSNNNKLASTAAGAAAACLWPFFTKAMSYPCGECVVCVPAGCAAVLSDNPTRHTYTTKHTINNKGEKTHKTNNSQ